MRQAEEAAAHGCMKDFCDITRKLAGKIQQTSSQVRDTKVNILTKEDEQLKDVCAHCYCASLVRTLFIRHARAKSFSSSYTKSKTQQNIELMTFALTWCANISVGCSVTPTFFSADHFLL